MSQLLDDNYFNYECNKHYVVQNLPLSMIEDLIR
jgi:hypothetical protein